MAQFDEQAHRDAVEYYRLTLAAHKKDAHATATAKVDEEVLAMVRETPDMLAMNKKFMAGGLAFATARAIAVDGAAYQAEVYEELAEDALAACWRRRAAALAAAEDYERLYAVSGEMDAEEAPVKENEARVKALVPTIIEKLLLAAASPAGTDLDEQPRATLVASLDELETRLPGVRFPAALDFPRVRARLAYDDGQIKKLAELFETVNRERLGGGY